MQTSDAPRGEHGAIQWDAWWDDTDPSNAGWYIEYRSPSAVVSDSQKLDHPDLPRRRDAIRAIERIAKRHARHLDRPRSHR